MPVVRGHQDDATKSPELTATRVQGQEMEKFIDRTIAEVKQRKIDKP